MFRDLNEMDYNKNNKTIKKKNTRKVTKNYKKL